MLINKILKFFYNYDYKNKAYDNFKKKFNER